jgi:hypothetical protein
VAHDIAGQAGIAVALPRAADLVGPFEHGDIGVARLTQVVRRADTGRPGADHDDSSLLFGGWSIVRHALTVVSLADCDGHGSRRVAHLGRNAAGRSCVTLAPATFAPWLVPWRHSVGSGPCLSLRRKPVSCAGGRCSGARSGSDRGMRSGTARRPVVGGVCSRSTMNWSPRSWNCSRGVRVARASVRTMRHALWGALNGSSSLNPHALRHDV